MAAILSQPQCVNSLWPIIIMIMGPMAFLLHLWRPHERRGLLPIIMLPDRDFLKRCTYASFFKFWLFEGVVVIKRKPWKGGVTNFGWKPPLTNPRHFASQRSTSHAPQELHHTPGAPIGPVVLPSHGIVAGRDFLTEADPRTEPRLLARRRWHATATPHSQRSCDVIWGHRSRATLAQVMACHCVAPYHYLNQC